MSVKAKYELLKCAMSGHLINFFIPVIQHHKPDLTAIADLLKHGHNAFLASFYITCYLLMFFTTHELIANTKDILVALAAVVAATVAVKGLNTWNRQLRGTAYFDVARGLAKATYKVRERIQACRSPLLLAQEFPPEYHDAEGNRSSEQEAKGYAFVYSNRWLPVWEAMQEFDVSVLEAEALWGQPIRGAADSLRKVVREVNIAIDAFISDAASGGENFSNDREFGKRMRSIVSALPTNSENELNKKLAAAVQAIDDQLRPHLQRS